MPMQSHYYAMIMAGGGGSRLWPMSRGLTPKQLLPLVEDKSMFRVSVERLAPLFSPEQIYVVAGRQYGAALQAEAPEIPCQNFIIEPYGKDSGPAALLGMTVLCHRDPEATVAILTADHHIADKTGFRASLQSAYDAAQQNYIVTLGIMPTFPSTAFGYIRRGTPIALFKELTAYCTLGFTEKPKLEKAIEFLMSEDYSWNSGMFIWKGSQALAEFKRQQPDLYGQLALLMNTVDTADFEPSLLNIWDKVEKISLDYAVMEDAERMAVIPVSIGWSDVGSWASLYDMVDLDEDGNSFKGQTASHIIIDTHNALVYADKMTVLIGMEDCVVVDTPDALLICHKDRTQDVKEAVAHLKTGGHHNLL